MTQPDIFDDDAPWAEWLPELRMLLYAYDAFPRAERFTDTEDRPSKAMRSYLRMATYYPGRAYRATCEILDVLGYGLDEADVASNLASMATIFPPPGRTREQCLEAMIPHLVAFTENGEHIEPALPESSWEWTETFPNLSSMLGSYFHQDADAEHPDAPNLHEAVIDDYLAHEDAYEIAAAAREIGQLLAMGLSEAQLQDWYERAGIYWLPPPGLTYAQWLDHLATRFTAHLDTTDYQPADGPDPAYPAHDTRSRHPSQ